MTEFKKKMEAYYTLHELGNDNPSEEQVLEWMRYHQDKDAADIKTTSEAMCQASEKIRLYRYCGLDQRADNLYTAIRTRGGSTGANDSFSQIRYSLEELLKRIGTQPPLIVALQSSLIDINPHNTEAYRQARRDPIKRANDCIEADRLHQMREINYYHNYQREVRISPDLLQSKENVKWLDTQLPDSLEHARDMILAAHTLGLRVPFRIPAQRTKESYKQARSLAIQYHSRYLTRRGYRR